MQAMINVLSKCGNALYMVVAFVGREQHKMYAEIHSTVSSNSLIRS